MTKYYTGIGARKTPKRIFRKMRMYGDLLGGFSTILRSGAADGADTAFEVGCDRSNGPKEIYLPWKGYNNHSSTLYHVPNGVMAYAATVYGDNWKYLNKPIKLLMARDVQQVIGQDFDSTSEFILCWTPDGCASRDCRTKKTGGTGQAIAVASDLGIPIFNLHNEPAETQFIEFLKERYGDE